MCGRPTPIILCVRAVLTTPKLNNILLYNPVSGNSPSVGVLLVALTVYDMFYNCSCRKKWAVNLVRTNILLLESAMLLLDA